MNLVSRKITFKLFFVQIEIVKQKNIKNINHVGCNLSILSTP